MKAIVYSEVAQMIIKVIGLMNVALTNDHIAGRGVGASTSYPVVAGKLFDLETSRYFRQVDAAGSWEVFFIAGAFVGALIGSVAFKHFEFRVVPALWAELKGPSKIQRLIWAFVGGFILIFGARLADGCTSGHILSGGMELAVSSLVFALFVFVSLYFSTRVFYRGNAQ